MTDIITPEWVRAEVTKIEECSLDNEQAHEMQDILFKTVLRAIAQNKIVNASKCAQEALKVLNIDFERWYG